MRIACDTPRKLATTMVDEMRSAGHEACARPFDRYSGMEGNIWWAVPGMHWPAYRHMKVVASSRPGFVAAGDMFVGLCVEKGMEANATGKQNNWSMDSSWCWHTFVRDLSTGSLARPLERATKALGAPMEILVEASFATEGAKLDHLKLETEDGESIRWMTRDLETPEKLLVACSQSTDLRSIGDALQRIPSGEWVWVDFYLGHRFEVARLADTDALDAKQIWESMISPFEHWLR